GWRRSRARGRPPPDSAGRSSTCSRSRVPRCRRSGTSSAARPCRPATTWPPASTSCSSTWARVRAGTPSAPGGPCSSPPSRPGRALLAPDFTAESPTRWPAFAAALDDDGLRSIFAFPLTVGPLRIGAVDLYSVQRVELDRTQTEQADAMAGAVGRHVLRQALNAVGRDYDYDGNAYSRRVVHQASGMVLAQLGISADDARLVIQGHAFAASR